MKTQLVFLLLVCAAITQAKEKEPKKPRLILDGYCPVTLQEEKAWKRGRPELREVYQERLYFFTTAEKRTQFKRKPEKYAPVYMGLDVVRLLDDHQEVLGDRQYGTWHHNRIYLFTNEASLNKFTRAPEKYALLAKNHFHETRLQLRAARKDLPRISPTALFEKLPGKWKGHCQVWSESGERLARAPVGGKIQVAAKDHALRHTYQFSVKDEPHRGEETIIHETETDSYTISRLGYGPQEVSLLSRGKAVEHGLLLLGKQASHLWRTEYCLLDNDRLKISVTRLDSNGEETPVLEILYRRQQVKPQKKAHAAAENETVRQAANG